MTNKFAYVIVILLIITNVITGYWCFKGQDTIQYQEKIDSLYFSNDSLETLNQVLRDKIDSLSKEINVVDSIIVEINHWYERSLDSIVGLSDDEQLHFFTDYLSKNSSGFSSNNNNDTIKTN